MFKLKGCATKVVKNDKLLDWTEENAKNLTSLRKINENNKLGWEAPPEGDEFEWSDDENGFFTRTVLPGDIWIDRTMYGASKYYVWLNEEKTHEEETLDSLENLSKKDPYKSLGTYVDSLKRVEYLFR